MTRHLRVCAHILTTVMVFQLKANEMAVIARNALAQEESEEYSGDFDDPINIHIDNDRDGCAC